MKVKRQKKVGRILSFFKHNYGHHPPYQVLIDGTFCQACLKMKVNIKEQLPKYIGEVKLLTTKCCIQECEKLGPELSGATAILKQFPIHKCGHDPPKSARTCLQSMIKASKSNHYFLATNDQFLREKCRKVVGTPLMYLHHCAPVLEKPSGMSENHAKQTVDDRMTGDQKRVENLKKQLGLVQTEVKAKKKRKSGNPNPLSCLKSKKKPLIHQVQQKENDGGADNHGGKKRKRVRNRKKKSEVSAE